MLPESDSQHCIRVLRMKCGDKVEVVDGKGNRYVCEITDANPKRTRVEILTSESVEKENEHRICVAVAPTKHIDRMEWLVEKLTEIGIDRIVPLQCERSERKEIKRERLEKIAVAAMKQSLRCHLPEIDEMRKFKDVANEFEGFKKYIAYCDESIERKELTEIFEPGCDSVIMIGPEGDFSSEEIRMSLAQGWQPVSLGKNRLRTETAALSAVNAMHVIDSVQRQGRSF